MKATHRVQGRIWVRREVQIRVSRVGILLYLMSACRKPAHGFTPRAVVHDSSASEEQEIVKQPCDVRVGLVDRCNHGEIVFNAKLLH